MARIFSDMLVLALPWSRMRLRCCFPHFPFSVPILCCWNDLWFWMWPLLPLTCLCVAPNEWKFSSLQLCNLDSLSSCHPKWLRCTGVGRWEGRDAEPDAETPQCGDLVQMMWGDRKQKPPWILYPRGGKASLWIGNVCKCRQPPKGNSCSHFPHQSCDSFWCCHWLMKQKPSCGPFDTDNQTVCSASSAQALFQELVPLLGTLLPAPLLPLPLPLSPSPTERTVLLTFPLKSSSNAASSEKSSPGSLPRLHSQHRCHTSYGCHTQCILSHRHESPPSDCQSPEASSAAYSFWHLPWQSTTANSFLNKWMGHIYYA